MKNFFKGLSFVAIAFILVLAPLDTANAVPYGGFLTCDGTDCSFCNLIDMVNGIVVWLFGIIFLIFAVLLLVAGFGLVTSGGNQTALDAAKTKFQNAIIGLIIVMASWLLIDTIMRGLVGSGPTAGQISGWGPWAEVQCQLQTDGLQYSRNASDDVYVPTTGAPTPPPSAGQYSHADAVSNLNNGITVRSSGECSDKTRTNCTSLEGIQQNTINGLNKFQQGFGGPIIVTGGTEAGHASGDYSHGNGYKIDLSSKDSSVNNYIMNNFTRVSGSNSKWQDPDGNIYYRHGPPDHWDISFVGNH